MFLLDSTVSDLEITEGTVFVNGGSIDGTLIVTDGSLIGEGLTVVGGTTITVADNRTIQLSNIRCFGGLTIIGGSTGDLIVNGLTIPTGRLTVTGTFNEFSITNAVIGQKTSSTTYASGGLVDFTDLTSFRFDAEIYRAHHSALRMEDCVAGHVSVHAIDPCRAADNTDDAIDLVGACGQLYISGSVYGAVNQANNPRYALAAAAGTTAPVDVFMSMAGYQTGAVNDASGNVVVH
jgi:hypothetical protein